MWTQGYGIRKGTLSIRMKIHMVGQVRSHRSRRPALHSPVEAAGAPPLLAVDPPLAQRPPRAAQQLLARRRPNAEERFAELFELRFGRPRGSVPSSSTSSASSPRVAKALSAPTCPRTSPPASRAIRRPRPPPRRRRQHILSALDGSCVWSPDDPPARLSTPPS